MFNRIQNQLDSDSTWVYFGKIAQWPHISDENFKKLSVWNTEHENYDDFVDEVNKLYSFGKTFENMGFGGINIQSNFTNLDKTKINKFI